MLGTLFDNGPSWASHVSPVGERSFFKNQAGNYP
jgi:hypothetical protein